MPLAAISQTIGLKTIEMGKSQRTVQHSPKQSWIQRITARHRGKKGSGGTLKPLPSFFIVGPPRTGTSWLQEILREHAVLPIATKETRFFDTHFHRGLEWYLAHFPPAIDGYRVGEVAPTYFASFEARTRIAELLPAARIVCIFRNPVERIVSLYRVKRAYGFIPWTLEEAIAEDPEFLSTSRYSENYRAWQSALGPEQVMATLYDDLCADPQSYLDRLVDFVGEPRFTLAPAQRDSVHASDHLTHPRSYTCTRNATRLANWLKAQRFGPGGGNDSELSAAPVLSQRRPSIHTAVGRPDEAPVRTLRA